MDLVPHSHENTKQPISTMEETIEEGGFNSKTLSCLQV